MGSLHNSVSANQFFRNMEPYDDMQHGIGEARSGESESNTQYTGNLRAGQASIVTSCHAVKEAASQLICSTVIYCVRY